MITIKRKDWQKYGKTVILKCPKCEASDRLNHTIEKDGTVNPSVVCVNGTCNFHEFVKLEGWE